MTQTEQILQRLRKGPLTSIEALAEIGCFRLAARIHDLRRQGHRIVGSTVEVASGKKVAKYYLLEGRAA